MSEMSYFNAIHFYYDEGRKLISMQEAGDTDAGLMIIIMPFIIMHYFYRLLTTRYYDASSEDDIDAAAGYTHQIESSMTADMTCLMLLALTHTTLYSPRKSPAAPLL